MLCDIMLTNNIYKEQRGILPIDSCFENPPAPIIFKLYWEGKENPWMYGVKQDISYLRLGKTFFCLIPCRAFAWLYRVNQGLANLDSNHLRNTGVGEGCNYLAKWLGERNVFLWVKVFSYSRIKKQYFLYNLKKAFLGSQI